MSSLDTLLLIGWALGLHQLWLALRLRRTERVASVLARLYSAILGVRLVAREEPLNQVTSSVGSTWFTRWDPDFLEAGQRS